MWWTPSTIHGSIDNALDCLISPLKGFLMLIMWLTSPDLDPKHSEIVKHLMTIVARCAVTNQLGRSSPCGNKTLECLEKFSLWCDVFNMNEFGCSANEDIGICESDVNCRNLGLNLIH